MSVIITTYNRAHLIDQAIESVLSQTYPNKELIVVDDFSKDGSADQIENRWGDKLRLIRHDRNQGVQFASNTGYRAARGQYLAFIGDDDTFCDPEKLSKQVKIFESDKTKSLGVVTSSVRVLKAGQKFDRIIHRPKNLLKHLLVHNGIIYGSAALLRREAFERAGLFAEELPKGTDSDVYRRMVMVGYDVEFMHEPTIEYREEGDDRMTARDERGTRRSIKAMLYLLDRYGEFFDLYPDCKSQRLYSLAAHYSDLYRLIRNREHLKTAGRLYLRAWRVWPLNWRALTKFLLNMVFRLSPQPWLMKRL